jgi:peptidoglycan/LPS O-acetylase OafA/YrhL
MRIQQAAPHWILWTINGSGVKGVQLFFAISGFLITSRLIEEWNCFGRISLKRFYIRRVCRILPPAMTYLFVIAVLGVAGVLSFQWKYWLSAACFFRNYMPPGGPVFEMHYWSLSIEEQFYLLWPALLVLFGVYRGRYTAMILVLLVWIWRWIAFRHVWGFTARLGDFWSRSDICFDGLLLGCFFALALESPQVKKCLTKYLSVTAVVAIVVIILATGGSTYTPGGRAIQSLLMPCIIVATILHPHTWLGRLLEVAPIRWVGRLSYSLYIWQQLFTFEAFIPWYTLRLVCLFGVAALSFYGIEKPMIRLGYRLAPPSSLGHSDLGAGTPATGKRAPDSQTALVG